MQYEVRKQMMCQPFNIAVCDDNPTDRETIATMTKTVCEMEDIHAEISCFAAAEDFFKELETGKQYHLLLLDVVMPVQDGMELAKQIRGERKEIPIVFISNDREMALQGYEVAALRYLAKPLKLEKLREAVVLCYKENQSKRELYIPGNGGIERINPKDIYFIEIYGRKSRIWQSEEELETGLSLEQLEEMLQGRGFLRCHKSFLVNCRYIRHFCTSLIELVDGRKIPVSKHRIKEVRKAFFDYIKE